MSARRLSITLTIAVALSLAWSGSASADLWKKNGGDCNETAFKRPVETALKKVARCVRLYEAYNNGTFADDDSPKKRKVITALRRLYKVGTDVDASVARVGLARLGIAVPPKTGAPPSKSSNTGGAATKTTRVKFVGCPGGQRPPAPPDKKAKKKAKKAFKKGMKAYRKDDFEGALGHFQSMLEIAPGSYKAIYNVATMSAKTGSVKKAIGLLWCLRDLGTPSALRKIKDARKDSDFEDLRRNDAFKVATGYARIMILDSLPDGRGDDNVSNLRDRIEKLKYEVIAVKPDANEKTKPHVWYRHTNRVQAYIFKKILSHPHTKLERMPPALEKRGFDIIISWGDRYKKDEDPTLRINELGDEADKELKDIEKTEDQILSKPDEYEKDVEDGLGEGDQYTKKVDDTADTIDDLSKKPGETIEKATDTVDKLKSPL